MKVKHVIFLALAIGLCIPPALGQPADELKKYQEIYPDDDVVYLLKKGSINIELENGELVIHEENEEQRFFLTSNAGRYSRRSIQYSSFSEVEEVKAETMVPSKRKYKREKVKDIETREILSDRVFRDDITEKRFLYPGLQQGAKTYLWYRQKITDPKFLGGFHFAGVSPIEKIEFVITHPVAVKMEFKTFHFDEWAIEYSREEKKGIITHRWVGKDLKKLRLQASAPNPRYYMPHIIPIIREYQVAAMSAGRQGQTVPVLRNTDDLYGWYYSLVRDVNSEKVKSDKALNTIVDSLLAGVTNELEKVTKIYYWVQDNIKYIAVEEGMGGFIPRNAAAVCDKRYGDCKDMTSIMQAMLSIAGIESHFTWIGTRDIPYTYDQVSSPATDNHMILCYINGDDHYFLDATNSNLPLGIPSSFIQGQQALVGIDSGKYILRMVPEVDHTVNTTTDTVWMRINNGSVTGKGVSWLSGYSKIYNVSRFTDLTDEKLIERSKDHFNKGNNKFTISKVDMKNLKDREKDLYFSYEYKIDDYVQESKDEIYVNMNLDREVFGSKIDNETEHDIHLDYKLLENYTVNLDIPEGYDVSYLPTSDKFEHENFGYSISYVKQNGTIGYNFSVYIKTLVLEKEDFEEYNKMLKQFKQSCSEVVVLKQLEN